MLPHTSPSDVCFLELRGGLSMVSRRSKGQTAVLWTGQALQLLLISAFVAWWGMTKSWGSRGCCAEQRRTHLPPTLFSSARAKQGNNLRNAAGGRPQQWVYSASYYPEMCVVWGSLIWSGQGRDELGCCCLVPEQISRLSSSKTRHRHFKPKHQPAASDLGSLWTGSRTHQDFQLPLQLTPALWSLFQYFSDWGWPYSPLYSTWGFIAFRVIEALCLSKEWWYPTAADTAVTKLRGLRVTWS